MDLPELLKGPGNFARRLLQEHNMNDEQIDAIALFIWPMEKDFRAREDTGTHMLPVANPLARVAVIGGGGCGKITTLMKVLSPHFRRISECDFACSAFQ